MEIFGPVNLYRFICGYSKYNRIIWSNDERYQKRLEYESKGNRYGRYQAGTHRTDGLALPDGYGISQVLNCEYIGEEEVYDLSTSDSHTFIAEGLVVHNTSKQDEINFLTKTIIPDCQFIESILNEQLFGPLGLHWEFMPETLDAMQEDETSRAQALQQLTAAGIPLLMAMDILGYELDDEDRAELEAAEAEKKAKAEQMAQQMAQKPEEPQDEEQPEDESDTTSDTTFKNEMDKWKRKALNAMKKGKPANVDFATTIIPGDVCETIMSALVTAKSEDDVREIFKTTITPKMEFDGGIMALAAELRRANDLLEKTVE